MEPKMITVYAKFNFNTKTWDLFSAEEMYWADDDFDVMFDVHEVLYAEYVKAKNHYHFLASEVLKRAYNGRVR